MMDNLSFETTHEIEVIPYEMLWDLAIETLKSAK
jgi:hypothetical protein